MTTLQLLKEAGIDCSGIKIIQNTLPTVMVSRQSGSPSSLDQFGQELIAIVENLPKEEVSYVALYTVIIIICLFTAIDLFYNQKQFVCMYVL